MKLPYLTGLPLRLFVSLLEGPLRGLMTPTLLRQMGVTYLRGLEIDEPPTLLPIAYTGTLASEAGGIPLTDLPDTPVEPGPGFRFATVQDYARSYREGKTDPQEVAHRVLEAIRASDATDPPLRVFFAVDREDVLRQAQASAQRIRNGRRLSVLDGVPVAIKDEVDMVPYPTTVGTSFLGRAPAVEDSTVVARLRAAGALLLGKASMHEVGVGMTGLNLQRGTTRNPYNVGHYPGGSAGGPAAAVAAGLCPVAIGADGGGSVRVPASFCGVVGLKATFGRVSERGAFPLTWSLAHLGPLAATATDAVLAYGVIAGPDPQDPVSLHQPLPTLEGWDTPDLRDLRLGVFWPWFRHATAEVVAACEALLGHFEAIGAEVREVSIPDLEASRIAHLITIATEIGQSLSRYDAEHGRDLGPDVRTNLALARELTAQDYVQAQRVRTRLMANFQRVLEHVDLILTPASGVTAPPIPPAALSHGESDLSTLTEIMRYAPPANVTGLPAISFPAGYDGAGLPIGMQAIGRAWDEPTLLRLALAAERVVERRRPQVYYDILGA
jgi:Asp-tRNA(Asn)/Glu-tRNA(Gln) amidotransferase A subunit family amidase